MLQPHQERAIQEQKDLSEKIQKLEIFFKGDVYRTLPQEDQDDMSDQHIYMCLYLSKLNARISRF